MLSINELNEALENPRPVLIAGPTASGKSALAIWIARQFGGEIINADALQVYDAWRVLTARPSENDESLVPHHLYGHVPAEVAYSTGAWLRDLDPLLQSVARPIIVGGTGLNFTALTEGLATIPPVPQDVRDTADSLELDEMVKALDPVTLSRIDVANRARVQRAWEVMSATGLSLSHWQDNTPPPKLPISECLAIVVEADKEFLTPRIERRFELMMEQGALEEVRANANRFDWSKPAYKAIGAPELMAYLEGKSSREDAKIAATIATRQYAKRQRTWFRSRMSKWARIDARELAVLKVA